MLKIRLTRRGKKNNAFYRLVVAEHTSPIKGRFLEGLGFLNPHTKEKNFKEDRIKHWLKNGAQCSDTVHNLLVSSGVITGKKRPVKMKKKAEEANPESAPKAAEAQAKVPEEKAKVESVTEKAEEVKVAAEEKKEEAPKEAEVKTSGDTPKEEKAS
jgi:small subunit ribosomal protein S16